MTLPGLPLVVRLLPAASHRDFCRLYEDNGGFALSLAYVNRCKAYGLFDSSNGDMVGGFLVNLSAPYRTLEDMPVDDARRIEATLDPDDVFEAACMWIVPRLRRGPDSVAAWALFYRTLLAQGRSTLLGCTVSQGVWALYRRTRPVVLYQGRIGEGASSLPKTVFIIRPLSRCVPLIATEGLRRVVVTGARTLAHAPLLRPVVPGLLRPRSIMAGGLS